MKQEKRTTNPNLKSARTDRIGLVLFDLDETLTTGPTIWELLHYEMGTWESHGLRFWDEFRAEKFGFNAFIRKDVACWKGMPVESLQRAIRGIKYIPEIKNTMTALKKRGIKTALVSSSVEQFAEYTARKFGIDYVFANHIEIKGGTMTGRVILNVPGLGKGRVTRALRRRLGLKKGETAALGDSTYDLPMFREVGTSITFHDAKKELKEQVGHVIRKNELSGLMAIIDKINKA